MARRLSYLVENLRAALITIISARHEYNQRVTSSYAYLDHCLFTSPHAIQLVMHNWRVSFLSGSTVKRSVKEMMCAKSKTKA